MPVRNAKAVWEGTFAEGKGTLDVGSGLFMGAKYSAGSRFESDPGTNPEELIGAANAGCFSMALSAGLSKDKFKPKNISTSAKVHIDKVGDGFKITKIELSTEAVIPDIDEATFMKYANGAKEGCPVSQALAAIEITLSAKLVK
jgi:osmotically inducible protein OsmC